MKRIIVTGADGFVGSAVTYELIKNNYEVVAIDLPVKPKRLTLNSENLKYISLKLGTDDIFCQANLNEDFDTIYHFAWRGSAGPERADESIQLQNALISSSLLRASAKHGITRFIMAGSIMEYEVNSLVYMQESKPSLSYIYGAGKTIAHEIMKPIANAIGIDLIWAYITNAYGVGERSPRFLNSTLLKIANGKEQTFTSGTQNYDFIYITDVAKAFRLIGESGRANKGYIIGSGKAKQLRDFVKEIYETLAPNLKPNFGSIPYNGAMLPLEVFSISDIEKDCGFKPSVDFKEGISKTLKWLESTEEK